MVEVVQHRVYIAPRQVLVIKQKLCPIKSCLLHPTSRYNNIRHPKMCVACKMSSGRYLNFRGRVSSFDKSRLARRMANVDENKDVYQTVINVAKKAGSQVSSSDIKTLVKPGQGCSIIAKFVRRHSKIGLMTHISKLKEREIRTYVNDDFTLLRARLCKACDNVRM